MIIIIMMIIMTNAFIQKGGFLNNAELKIVNKSIQKNTERTQTLQHRGKKAR